MISEEKMNAAAIDEFGGRMFTHTLPVPKPGPGEILLRVESAGVGVWDPFEAEGGFAELTGIKPAFPYVLGSDGAGTVEAVGRDVLGFAPGDRVYATSLANPKGGFYAEYAVANADDASPIPANLTVEQAGAMPVDALTALAGLEDVLHLKAGQSVLILGASGGIGHIAVQLAKRMGARVFAVASGDDGVRLANELGADAAVDGHGPDVIKAARQFAPGGIDAALLTAGGAAAEAALTTLRKGARVAYPNGVEPVPQPREGLTIESYDVAPGRDAIQRLNRYIEMEPFRVHVARTFPLDQATAAHRALDKHYLGKLVLQPRR